MLPCYDIWAVVEFVFGAYSAPVCNSFCNSCCPKTNPLPFITRLWLLLLLLFFINSLTLHDGGRKDCTLPPMLQLTSCMEQR